MESIGLLSGGIFQCYVSKVIRRWKEYEFILWIVWRWLFLYVKKIKCFLIQNSSYAAELQLIIVGYRVFQNFVFLFPTIGIKSM